MFSKLRITDIALFTVSAIGFIISCYAYIVELKIEANPKYVPFCDISEHVSCSKAFNSKYGRGFGLIGEVLGEHSQLNVPNVIPGMIFYLACTLLSLMKSPHSTKILFLFSTASIFLSLYLAYILYFKVYSLCIVCVSTYVVNVALFILSYSKLNVINSLDKKKEN